MIKTNHLFPIQTHPKRERWSKEASRLRKNLIRPKISFPTLKVLISNSYASFWNLAKNSSIIFLLFQSWLIKMGSVFRIIKLYTKLQNSNLPSKLCSHASIFIASFYFLGAFLTPRRITWEKYMSSKMPSRQKFSKGLIE